MLTVYDKTIQVLKSAVSRARLGNRKELSAIKRPDRQARILEKTAESPTFYAFIAKEKARLHEYGGRNVFGWEPAPAQDSTEALQKSAS